MREMKQNGNSSYERLWFALKHLDDSDRSVQDVQTIINEDRSAVTREREDDDYEGQTPLHIAICKENIPFIKLIMKHVQSEDLDKQATGRKFQKTGMMGELPLIVAALTLNQST